MPANLRAAPFRLRDQTGSWATLSQYRGRVVILTFMHALCTGSCPIIAQQVRGALNDLGSRARDTQALAISIEPIEDTPAMVTTFLHRQHVAGTLRYLIGPRSELQRVWKAYGIQPVVPGKRHSTFVFLIDRKGYERVGYDLNGLTPENLSHDIGVLLKK
jgi:protein SCO1/2